ncbi:MAG: type II secretion system protein [Sedimentisphaerales bacterium]
MKRKKSARQDGASRSTAFTLVELLIVLGIIAILVALLIPAVTMVRNTAKGTQQRAQLTTIEMGLTAFKNDYGDYPPSHGYDSSGNPVYTYCGAQTLAEALVGWDMMGFHPNSAWRADGEDKNGGNATYDPLKNRDVDGDGTPDTLKERKGPYLEVATANAFRLNQLFSNTGSLAPNTFVLCDVFGVKSVTIGGKTVKAGTPILYYKANTSSKTIDYTAIAYVKLIYNRLDNDQFVFNVKEMADRAKYPSHPTPVNPLAGSSIFFYDTYIADPKVTTIKWPCRPDSYLLISAGVDGLYGTSDDIHNF